MIKYLFILLVIVCACTSAEQKRLQDDLYAKMQIEKELMMQHLDRGYKFLEDGDMKAFYIEFNQYLKHQYASQELHDLWIKEITQ